MQPGLASLGDLLTQAQDFRGRSVSAMARASVEVAGIRKSWAGSMIFARSVLLAALEQRDLFI